MINAVAIQNNFFVDKDKVETPLRESEDMHSGDLPAR